ncbi:MAG: TPM domain-containing protein [Geminicoccaceae bacterium]
MGRLVCVLLLLLATAAAAAEPVWPRLSGRVVDEAGVLSQAARDSLTAKLAAHEQATGDQVVVATVPSLQGLSVEEFANRLFRAWGLGGAERDDGLLLLVAPSERKVRIEVGYGLEGTVTDAAASIIVQSLILPRFRAGDLQGGIEAGAGAVLDLLAADGTATSPNWPSEQRAVEEGIPWPVLLMFALVAFMLLSGMLRSRAVGGRGGRYPYPPVIVIPGGFGGGHGGSWGGGGGGGFSGGGGSSGGGGASGSW